MSAKRKKPVQHRSRKVESQPAVSVLERFHCSLIRYDFEIPMASFKMKAFSKETDLKIGDGWGAGLASDNPTSGYHAHFTGNASKEQINIRIEYFNNRVKRRAGHPPPSSEEIMAFVGSFVREPRYRALVYAAFGNEDKKWTSRFNLPFKVTMLGEEVVIDGVSLSLPRNKFGAMNGWVSKLGRKVIASVDLIRTVDFSSFDLVKELELLN